MKKQYLLAIGFIVYIFVLALITVPAESRTEIDVEVKRLVDADTFDFEGELLPDLLLSGRVRLMCINAPEKRTAKGRELIAHLKDLNIVSGRLDIIERDSFGRYLAFFYPEGWQISLNHYLFIEGSPYYNRLSKKDLADCKVRFGDAE